MLDVVALPRKGTRSNAIQEPESSDEFQRAHDKHSAVESAIDALINRPAGDWLWFWLPLAVAINADKILPSTSPGSAEHTQSL